MSITLKSILVRLLHQCRSYLSLTVQHQQGNNSPNYTVCQQPTTAVSRKAKHLKLSLLDLLAYNMSFEDVLTSPVRCNLFDNQVVVPLPELYCDAFVVKGCAFYYIQVPTLVEFSMLPTPVTKQCHITGQIVNS